MTTHIVLGLHTKTGELKFRSSAICGGLFKQLSVSHAGNY